MGRTNGAASESIDENDENFDDDASLPLEFYWKQIAASRQRQGKPAQLTPEERCLTVEGCELLLGREQEEETAFNKARAEKERIKRLRWTLPFELFMFAVGAGLWLLADVDWLSEGLSTRDAKLFYVVIGGIGLVSAAHSFLDLRATRLGTDYARKQLKIFGTTIFSLIVAASVFGVGAVLLGIGIVIHNSWLTGHFGMSDYFIVLFLAMILVKIFFLGVVLPWIGVLEKTTGVVFALIAFALLLVAYVTSLIYFTWPSVLETPLWPNTIIWALLLVWAWPFWWGIIASAMRLRALLTDRRAEAA